MTYKQLIKRFGSQAEVARALGVPQTTVSYWRNHFPKWRREWIAARVNGLDK
jgi:predicted XRE-type DNA-binding protein